MAHFTEYAKAADQGALGDTTFAPFNGDQVWTIVAVQTERIMGERAVIARNPGGTQRMELYSTGGYAGGYIGTRMTAREILGSDAERAELNLPHWTVGE